MFAVVFPLVVPVAVLDQEQSSIGAALRLEN
jgi:hypothetical protein